MPRILLRHIIAELLRVQILTASVLVAVIAFGAAIRPIMQNLLGAEEVLQFVTLASVPMLQYALPFAGAFAGTIVYARLAADNEIVAMSAAGLSYRRILMPAAALGLVLFLGMALLVDAGVPRFWTSMRRLITRDVTRLFVSSVERGEAFRVGNTQLYADEVMVIPGQDIAGKGVEEGMGQGMPSTRLALAGVAAIETGPDGRTQTEFTAEFATVDVYRTDESAFLKLLFRNATAFRDGEDALVYVPQAEPEAIDLGKGIQLEPKDLDSAGLLRVWNDVGGYHRVAEARREATSALTAVDAWTCVTKSLAETGTARFADAGGIRIYEVKNAQLMGSTLVPRGKTGDVREIELVEIERGVVTKRASVKQATLNAEPRPKGAGMRFELLARADTVADLRGLGSGRWPPRIVGLAAENCPAPDRDGLALEALVGEAKASPELQEGPAAQAAAAARAAGARIEREVDDVRADIVARIVQRINQSLSAPLMLLLGAVLAIRLRGGNPLQIYLIAFIPSIADILLISGGEQMLKDGTSLTGIFVASSGNLVILAVIADSLRRIARN
jgi:lipopolysaccharide export LptBFGC system permease protein LptF